MTATVLEHPRCGPVAPPASPQEAQIARLAAEAHTDPDSTARLFISPRTVEYHLRKVFTKLDIGSRNALRRALRHPDPGGVPA